MKKYLQAFFIWVSIIPVAILNGGFRENVLVKLGRAANPISGILLSICIFAIAYALIPRIAQCSKKDYIIFGIMWFFLTNLFDFSMFIKNGLGIADFLQVFNFTTGNFWIIVVISSLVAPFAAAKIKHRI